MDTRQMVTHPGALQLAQGPQALMFAALLERLLKDPRTGQFRAVDFFQYSVTFDNLAANGTSTQNISIQADSDFLAVAGVGTIRTAANAIVADPSALVDLSDSGSGRLVFDRPQDWQNVFGTAQRPAWLPVAKFFPRSASVAVTITDLSGAISNVRAAFWGIKVFGSSMGGQG